MFEDPAEALTEDLLPYIINYALRPEHRRDDFSPQLFYEQRATALYLSRLSHRWRKYAEPFLYTTVQLSHKDGDGARMISSKLERGWLAKEVRRVECRLSGDSDEDDSLVALVDKLASLNPPKELHLRVDEVWFQWHSVLEAKLRE